MRKLIALIGVMLICLFSSSISIYADNTEQKDGFMSRFAIISGIDTEKEMEATFDKARTISGTAKVGSEITIKVYEVYGDGELSEPEVYSLIVGSSGYFSQSVDLSLGENLVCVRASKDGASHEVKTSIKRKKSEIKSELFKNISFPKV